MKIICSIGRNVYIINRKERPINLLLIFSKKYDIIYIQSRKIIRQNSMEGFHMKAVYYFAISYVDDDGTKHLTTAQEEWEVRFYQRRFYNVSVSTFKISL